MWSSEDCSGSPQSMALNILIEELNGTVIETRCDGQPCKSKIVQNLYEINQCGQEIDQNTKYSQSAMIPNTCIVGARYSVKHRCMKGKDHGQKVKSIYSDNECKKKSKHMCQNVISINYRIIRTLALNLERMIKLVSYLIIVAFAQISDIDIVFVVPNYYIRHDKNHTLTSCCVNL